ncbi:MAG TPA: glycoside hydrolase family 2, partial [Armatimonadetes bacterium]|nr:glycoside hydrolase family 2 [Armatimonadota bacterium]
MYAQSLDGAWQVRESGGREWIPAEVPGCIHTDLLSAGLIPNPFAEDNELRVSWVAEAGWIYKREFHPTPELLNEERIFLECDGLDTLASISINGEEVAGTDNMHRRYSFDVTELLHPGPNTIEISFASPVEYVRRLLGTDPYVTSPADSIPGSPYIRKAMYQWGWDWAPKIP